MIPVHPQQPHNFSVAKTIICFKSGAGMIQVRDDTPMTRGLAHGLELLSMPAVHACGG